MWKHAVFSGLYFPIFGLNTEISGVNFRYSAQSWENTDQEKLRILQCIIVRINQTMEDDTSFQTMLGVDTLLQNLL